jgi:hypothetical protein
VWVLRIAYPASTADAATLARFAPIVEHGRANGIVVQLVPIEG